MRRHLAHYGVVSPLGLLNQAWFMPGSGELRQSTFDLFLLYVIGAVGVLMRRFDFPTAPVVVGMILGPLAEAQLRNAMSIGEGKWSVFADRPVSVFLLIVIAAVLIVPRVLKRRAAAA